MKFDAFQRSLADTRPPFGLSPALEALWHAARESTPMALHISENDPSRAGAWVHAHIYRQIGDLLNADLWYQRAGRLRPEEPVEEEWEYIARKLTSW